MAKIYELIKALNEIKDIGPDDKLINFGIWKTIGSTINAKNSACDTGAKKTSINLICDAWGMNEKITEQHEGRI